MVSAEREIAPSFRQLKSAAHPLARAANGNNYSGKQRVILPEKNYCLITSPVKGRGALCVMAMPAFTSRQEFFNGAIQIVLSAKVTLINWVVNS